MPAGAERSNRVDDQRFDRFTRILATAASRRNGLRAIAGAAALALFRDATLRASASHATLGPGDACRKSSQCVAADAPLVCADNGFTYDGPLNCCTYEGSRCGFDEACCGTAVCLNGYCASPPDYRGQGQLCQNSSQCVAADTALVCDYVAHTDDYRCCALDGDRCGGRGGCCGWLRCVNGRCQ